MIESRNILSLVSLSSSIDELAGKGILSVRAMNGCRANGLSKLADISKLTREEVMRWRNCGRITADELIRLADNVKEEIKFAPSETESPRASQSNDSIASLYNIQRGVDFDELIKHFLGLAINQKGTNILSLHTHRVQLLADNTLSEDKESLIALFDYIADPRYKNFLEKKKGVILEIEEKIDNLYSRISKLILASNFCDKVVSLSKQIAAYASLKNTYPFLDENEYAFCLEYKQQYQELPKLFILYKSLIRSKNRNARLLCFRYGLYADNVRCTLDELAERFDLTRERVRQLTDVGGKAIKSVVPYVLDKESDFDNIVFMSEEDEYVSNIIQKQNLNVTSRQLLILIDIISVRLGSKNFCKGGKLYLYSWNLWNALELERLDSFIKAQVHNKRMQDIEMNIKDLYERSCVCSKPQDFN